MQDSTQRKLGAILSYVSIFASTLLQLLYTPFLIKMLGQSEYGLYSLIASIIGYLTVLDLGFGNAIVVYTAKYRAQGKVEEEKKLHGMFKIIFKLIGMIAFFLGIILFFSVNYIFNNTMTATEISEAKIMMLILSLNLMLSFNFAIYSSIITAYEKFIFQKIMVLINIILKPILMIPLLILGYKAIAMTIILTIVNMIVLLSNYFYCKNNLKIKIKYSGFDKNLFKVIFGYSIWIFIGVIVDKINWSVDQFVLGAVSGTIAVSVYSAASTINQLFINLSSAISGVMLPKISKMISKNATNEEITNEFIKVGRLQYLLIFLMCSGFTLFGKEFFITWVGKDFIVSYYISLLLIIPLCIPLIQNLGISIMQAKNLHKFRSILYLIIAIANIILSIPLASKLQGIGSALGTAISLLVGNGIIINIYYKKKVGIDVVKFWKSILKMTIPNIIPIVLILIIMNYIKLHGYAYLLIFGGIYSILYFITAYFLVMNDYEKNIVNKIFKKLHLKRG